MSSEKDKWGGRGGRERDEGMKEERNKFWPNEHVWSINKRLPETVGFPIIHIGLPAWFFPKDKSQNKQKRACCFFFFFLTLTCSSTSISYLGKAQTPVPTMTHWRSMNTDFWDSHWGLWTGSPGVSETSCSTHSQVTNVAALSQAGETLSPLPQVSQVRHPIPPLMLLFLWLLASCFSITSLDSTKGNMSPKWIPCSSLTPPD